MAISIFPSTAAEFVSNNFVVDMNDTSNNTADTGGVKQAGPYSMSFSSGDSSFDVYLIDDEGNSVGYSNSTSINASGLFSTVVILGVAQDEVISFTYQGSVNNADGEGDEPGAGAYLESISPSDLPTIDDTATVTGGNFGADTEIKFESGATVLDAKNITVNNSTELIVTRPDNLDPDLDPWTLRAITTGVPQPSGTNPNILTDAVTAGAVPSWVTTSPLEIGAIGVAYTDTLEATDADGAVTYTVTTGTLPTGLSLDSSTGVISGTPTAAGQTFTVTATDDGGNQTTREFTLAIQLATGGTVSQDSTHIYHTFTSSDSISLLSASATYEYLLVAGGGGASNGTSNKGAGGAGAGGLLSGTLSEDDYTITIGAGGANSGSTASNGSDSEIVGVATAIGGGSGNQGTGSSGGSGGGAAGGNFLGGSGTAGQGNDGGDTASNAKDGGSGGGGAGEPGNDSIGGEGANGGDGVNTFSDWATATGLVFDGGFFAGGGAAGARSSTENFPGGAGGGGHTGYLSETSGAGEENSGGGAGGGGYLSDGNNGGSGVVIVRYAI